MHHRAKDITGLTVGFLTAIKYHGSNGKASLWEMHCVCGNVRLKNGLTAAELARETGVKPSTMYYRLKTGVALEQLTEAPDYTRKFTTSATAAHETGSRSSPVAHPSLSTTARTSPKQSRAT